VATSDSGTLHRRTPKTNATFDRFDICEAWSLAAHDYGQYGVITRLGRMHFRAPMLNTRGDLTENGQEIYDAISERMAQATNPYADHFPVHPYDREDA